MPWCARRRPRFIQHHDAVFLSSHARHAACSIGHTARQRRRQLIGAALIYSNHAFNTLGDTTWGCSSSPERCSWQRWLFAQGGVQYMVTHIQASNADTEESVKA